MEPVILRSLAIELHDLYVNGHTLRRSDIRFLHVLTWEYRPEEMSDTENLVTWSRLILLSRRYGLSEHDYLQELGVPPMQLQLWANGICLPQGIQIRKDLYRSIAYLVRMKQTTS